MADTASRGDGDGRHTTRASGAEADDAELDQDDVFHVLQTSRRRDALRYLRGADGPVSLRELAEQVAAWEHDVAVENLTSSQRQRVYISLYQSHLPKLDTRGIIDYDKDRGTIEETPLAAQFDPYLGLEESTAPDPWPLRYAGATACSVLILAAIGGSVVPIPGFVAAVLVVLLFGGLTAVHAVSEYY